MRLGTFLCLAVLSVSCSPQSVSRLHIMNGVEGDPRFRATLALTFDGNALCSASLISPYHVLTARHCVASIQERLAVHVGRDFKSPEESAEVKRVYTLPYLDEAPEGSIQLNGESWEAYDIALLELKSPILSVEPYQLMDRAYDWGATLQDFDPLMKRSIFIAGYGLTAEEGAAPNALNTVRYHTEVMIQDLKQGAAKTIAKNTGACSGDSGGSLIFPQSESGDFILSGALSTGNPCAQGLSIYNTYALSFPHLCWMKGIVNQNPNTVDFASHIRCDETGVVATLDAKAVCPELTATGDGQTLLDGVAGSIHKTECASIRDSLQQGRNLRLSGLQVHDVSLLAGGVFNELDLSFNKIDDLSQWTKTSVATELNLAHNRLTDLSGIARLGVLRSLIFDYNRVNELPANEWKELNSLRFWNNEVTRLPDLTASPKLRTIKGGRNKIANVGTLPSGLTDVYLEQNLLTDASFAQGLSQLAVLFLYQNRLKTFQMTDKVSLRWLTLQDNQLASLELDRLPSLYRLDFSGNPIETLKLGELPALHVLQADNTRLTALPDLSSMTSLRELWLRNNRIEVLDIAKLPKSLTHLELGWNQIKDISPLVELENLEILSLHGSVLESLEPLLKLPKLKYVAVDDIDNRFAAVRYELTQRGVKVSLNSSYGYPEIDFYALHQMLKTEFPELLTQELSDEEAVFLAGTTALGQIIKNRNTDLPDSFVRALLQEVFEAAGPGRYRLRTEVGMRVFRYIKDPKNFY